MFISKVFCLLALTFVTVQTFGQSENPKVVVVGAGLAGLTTACRLQQKGVDVHVYEARNRVGGRVLTAFVGDDIAELGGQNVSDGGDSENMPRLIEELGLELRIDKVRISHTRFYFDGAEMHSITQLLNDKHFHPEDLKHTLTRLSQKSSNMRGVLHSLFAEDDPIFKIFSVKLAAFEGGTIDKLSSYYGPTTLYHMLLGGIAVAHPDDSYVSLSSIRGGNSLLPEKMAKKLHDRLHLNKPLVAVSKDIDDSYLLTFEDGLRTRADILVLALPCSVYSDISFQDAVIEGDRLLAIKNIPYGTNSKIMIPFPQPPQKRIGLTNTRLVSFFNADNTIFTLYHTGETSRFSAKTISDLFNKEVPMLEKCFGDECPSLTTPVFAKDESFVRYSGPVGYSWPNDRFVKGTYSYIAPGQEETFTSIENIDGEEVKTLFAPIDQKLYFVGEHASVLMDVPGTMEAACESGERASRMILKALNRI